MLALNNASAVESGWKLVRKVTASEDAESVFRPLDLFARPADLAAQVHLAEMNVLIAAARVFIEHVRRRRASSSEFP